MDQQKAIEFLTKQIDLIPELKRGEKSSPTFTKWKRDSAITIEKIFGKESSHVREFTYISYYPSVISSLDTDPKYHKEYLKGLDEANQIMLSMIDEILQFGLAHEAPQISIDSLTLIEKLCNRFHLVARQLRVRREDRQTLEIDDEYDVQDVFHSLLHIWFDDIRPEEWTPSYAAGSSRIDFLLKQEQIVIEIKKTRKSLTTKHLAEELIIDSRKYQSHPDCKCLVCFVYDSEGRIGNPAGFENDLNVTNGSFKTIVIVSPKVK